jgi:hypothetical protein
MSGNPFAGPEIEAFAKVIRESHDKEAIAVLGAHNSAGCLLISLSNALSRFKKDIGPGEHWDAAAPLFGGFSVGRIVIAAANGFRHEDEWARSQKMSPRQKASYDIIIGVLAGRDPVGEPTLSRSVHIVHLLGNGTFDVLAKNVLTFAHNVARHVEGNG